MREIEESMQVPTTTLAPVPTPSWRLPIAMLAVVLAMWSTWLVVGARSAYQLLNADVRMGAPANATSAASSPAPPQLVDLGQLGDAFGGLNALFAAMTVAGVIWAASMQRAALVETRKALSEERSASQAQLSLSIRQQHEAMLSHLLLQLDSATDRVGAEEAAVDPQSPRGLACIEHIATLLAQRLRFGASLDDVVSRRRDFSDVYGDVLPRQGASNLLPYLRLLRFILSFIGSTSGSHVSAVTKRQYGDLVATHLTESAAFVYAIFEMQNSDPARLARIDEFALLSTAGEGAIPEFRALLETRFKPGAFGDPQEKSR